MTKVRGVEPMNVESRRPRETSNIERRMLNRERLNFWTSEP
jgi:hypothetical protein